MDRMRFIEHQRRRIALLDFSGIKEMTALNRPIVKAAAIVSNSSLHRAATSMIALFSRRRLEVFDSRDEALTWLVA